MLRYAVDKTKIKRTRGKMLTKCFDVKVAQNNF